MEWNCEEGELCVIPTLKSKMWGVYIDEQLAAVYNEYKLAESHWERCERRGEDCQVKFIPLPQ